MSVKRYSVGYKDSASGRYAAMLDNPDGGYVSYEDYAALEARFAALATAVQAVKSTALEEIEVINRGGQAYCVKDGMSVNPIYARGWNDYRAKSLSVETPGTDAFLAEVRAQGVEMFAKETSESDQGNGLMKAIGRRAIKFAANLRKGVQS